MGVGVQRRNSEYCMAASNPFMDKLDEAGYRFTAGADFFYAFDMPINDFEDRLDVQCGSHKAGAAPDPSAAVQELKRVHREDDTHLLAGVFGCLTGFLQVGSLAQHLHGV